MSTKDRRIRQTLPGRLRRAWRRLPDPAVPWGRSALAGERRASRAARWVSVDEVFAAAA
ncbi:hypothetical protein [Frondihabitans sp. Leaf304]|uniref:hypothetical protein n=1 Tax=Frondihabitans sp. Leaf304 TaxID=1736329 RepID=UPI0012FA81C5|nr:hypothetical protein [Frondihabitans sp. Leaf304]